MPASMLGFLVFNSRCLNIAFNKIINIVHTLYNIIAGDWLHAPPLTAVGLRLSDEAIRVAID